MARLAEVRPVPGERDAQARCWRALPDVIAKSAARLAVPPRAWRLHGGIGEGSVSGRARRRAGQNRICRRVVRYRHTRAYWFRDRQVHNPLLGVAGCTSPLSRHEGFKEIFRYVWGIPRRVSHVWPTRPWRLT